MSVDESRYSPTREPVFTETMQIGIVVRDLDASLRRYVEDYGIGPWQVHEFDPESAEDMHEYGQPVERPGRGAVTRFATTMVGQVMWELIEPLDEESIWARFLAEKGEGVHPRRLPGGWRLSLIGTPLPRRLTVPWPRCATAWRGHGERRGKVSRTSSASRCRSCEVPVEQDAPRSSPAWTRSSPSSPM